jgi:hypothetical protein
MSIPFIWGLKVGQGAAIGLETVHMTRKDLQWCMAVETQTEA